MRTKVKKLTSVILAVVMMLGILTIAPLTVSAATYGDFEYTLEDDYTCTITKYNGSAANVTIPSTIYGNKVSAIGRYAFEENPNIKKVSMPNSVKIIDRGAFWYCGNLESVTMPTSLKEIGRCAFYETNLKSLVLPTGLKYISKEAFKFCYNLKTVTLPNTVESLGDACFGSCTSMQSISIPNSVKDMRWSTFDRCTSLKTVTIGSGVDTMNAYSVFGGCTSLESITVNSANKDFSSANGILYNKYKSEILLYPINKKDTAYTVPSSIDTLYEMSANGNTYLKTVTIPSNIKDIGDYAFGYIGEKYNYQKVSGFTIKGYKGTAAERYARNNDFNFVQLQVVPTSVALNKTTLTLDTGKTSTLKATVYPSNAANKKCTWRSSNTSVATVDGNGKVTAKKAGTATITVKTSNGKTANCKVTVNLPAPQITGLANTTGGIKISWNKVDGAYGYRLYYKPASGGWKRFKDTTATSFTDSGVSPNRTETYTIRCIDKNGKTVSGFNSKGWSKKYTPAAPTISKLENTSGGIKLSWNKIAGVYGYRLYYKTSSGGWKRFKDTTATSFTDSGVSPNRTETYTIRCIDKNGKTVSGYNSKGWSKKYVYNPPKSIKLNKTSAYIGKKESVTLKYTLSAGSTSTVTWSSSNKNVATVSGGKVTAKGAGATTITATTANGKKATCKVTVINGKRKHLYVNSYRVRVCDFSVVVPDSCTVVYGDDCVVFVDKYNKNKYGSGTLMWVTFSGRRKETKEYYLGKINSTKIVYQYPMGAGVGNVLDKTASQKYQDSLKNMELSIKNTFRFE